MTPPRRHRPVRLRFLGLPHGLRRQFMLGAAMLLGLVCLVLSWFFIWQQTRTVTDGLYRSGILLAEHLAESSRYQLLSGDRDELSRRAREVLAVEEVSYVAILGADGRPLAAVGRGLWAPVLTTSAPMPVPLNPALTSPRREHPALGEVRLVNGHGTFSERNGFTVTSMMKLLAGLDVPLYYDIGVSILPDKSSAKYDSSLQLLFEQTTEPGVQSNMSLAPSLGFVEVGLSSMTVQKLLRTLIWQVIGITAMILVLSLLLLHVFSHRITTPLRRLTDAAARMAAGDLQTEVQPMTDDEIGDLTRVFSRMLHSIDERETALNTLNRTLEARIEAGTEELRVANRKLQELDRRKSLFVSTASHEIKTPLTAITCHLANLLTGIEGPLTNGQAAALERVQVNIERLQHLLVELLDLSRIELGQTTLDPEAVDLPTVMMQAVDSLRSLAAQKGLHFDLHLPPTLPLVAADADKLHQVLSNVLHNALKFSPNYGTVLVTAQPFARGFVRIAIQDAGCGVAPEEFERIFEPFYRSEEVPYSVRGTGLGLPIAKHLVELHGGRLWVESTLGQGACFFFTLPIWVPPSPVDGRQNTPALVSEHPAPVVEPSF